MKTINSWINFNDLMQWPSKDYMIQLNSYKVKASVTYETDNEELNFLDKEMIVQVSTDSQKGGSIFLFELDADTVFYRVHCKMAGFCF